MGHERLGLLPKSRRWEAIVDDLAGHVIGRPDVSTIAARVLQNISRELARTDSATGVADAVAFLLALGRRSREPETNLPSSEIGIDQNATALSIARTAREWMAGEEGITERRSLTISALLETIRDWHKAADHKSQQADFFRIRNDFSAVWSHADTPSGFCELTSTFLARYVDTHLRYILDREASGHIGDIEKRRSFDNGLAQYGDQIAQHAIETAEISKSFAAGWFAKHARRQFPSEKEIQGFASYALRKLVSELEREKSAR